MNTDFDKYAIKHLGISSGTLDGVKKYTENNRHNYQKMNAVTLYDATGAPITNTVTPTIIEERKMNVAMMSVFDRLMMDRIIWCAGPVDDRMAIILQAQLLYLADEDPKKTIKLHIDSPGGSVKSGLSMIDVMDYVREANGVSIETINTGMAASMGSVLLGAGTKGMRSSLRFSRTMIHQSSGGAVGNIQDARITWNEWEKINNTLFELLGDYCDKTAEQIKEDATRDLWLTADEALEYGIIDNVIGKSE